MSTSLSQSIRRRLPSRSDILQVFGVILFAVFGWSIRGFLYKIPSFTLYFGLTANLAILSYMFAFALLESALVMGLLLGLSMALPPPLFREGFAYKGFIVVLVATAAAIVFESWYQVEFFKDLMAGLTYPIPPFIIGIVVSIALIGILFWVFRALPRLQRVAVIVMEQLSIFTFVYVPLGLLGLIVVIIRNLP